MRKWQKTVKHTVLREFVRPYSKRMFNVYPYLILSYFIYVWRIKRLPIFAAPTYLCGRQPILKRLPFKICKFMKRFPFKIYKFCKELTFFKIQVHEALTFYSYDFIVFYIMSRVHLYSTACCLTMIADFKGRRRKQERLRKKQRRLLGGSRNILKAK